jgi:hypothetical protein
MHGPASRRPLASSWHERTGGCPVEEFIRVIQSSGLRRPIDDVLRMKAMLANSNLVITARVGADGRLIGVARSVTDFGYYCYLSDLCVHIAWQRRVSVAR